MESDQSLDAKEIGGINLDDYFPYRSSFNTVLYVHKRYAKKHQKGLMKETTEKIKRVKVKSTAKEEKDLKCNIRSSTNKKERKQDAVLQQTIKFAKNLVPIVIPPSEEDNTPVYYTIKTCTKCKNNGHVKEKCEKIDDVTFDKKRSKKLIDTTKKEKKNQRESYSAESSQCNTLDDIHLHQSLSATISEISEKRDKFHKNTINNKRKKRDANKLRISESFEGLATELNDNGDTNINIHLMNEKEKQFLCENIRIPILDAVNDRIKDLDNSGIKEGMKSMERLIMSNSDKLDNILERLGYIENYLASLKPRTPSSPKFKVRKPSRLEQLSEDIIDEKEYSSEEELPKPSYNNQREREQRDGITVLHSARMDKRMEDLGCGEFPERPSTSVGVRTERNRPPARFCWTDIEGNK